MSYYPPPYSGAPGYPPRQHQPYYSYPSPPQHRYVCSVPFPLEDVLSSLFGLLTRASPSPPAQCSSQDTRTAATPRNIVLRPPALTDTVILLSPMARLRHIIPTM